MLKLLGPLTPTYTQEIFTEEEWTRRLRPDGTPYATVNQDTGQHGHFGMDFNVNLKYGDPVFAGVEGRTKHVDFGSALGLQIGVIDRVTGDLLVFCHLSNRVPDGLLVVPSDRVGYVGNSGGVPTHLHFTVLQAGKGYGYFVDPVAALNDLKERLTYPVITFHVYHGDSTTPNLRVTDGPNAASVVGSDVTEALKRGFVTVTVRMVRT